MTARLEALLVAAGGAALGYAAGTPLNLSIPFAALAGANGLVGGLRGTYDWRRAAGWLAFLLDSTWGLAGTASGLAVQAVQAPFSPRLDPVMTRRRGAHVYLAGYRWNRRFTVTTGNCITNAAGASSTLSDRRRRLVERHEMLHVWQSRILGPVFPIAYAIWGVTGAVAGAVLTRSATSLRRSIVTMAYYNNPFEYAAYRRDDNWPPQGADPGIVWAKRTTKRKLSEPD